MGLDKTGENPIIEPDMTILNIVSNYRQTEEVFKRYDARAGVCLCCQALFDPLTDVARRYGLDLEELMADLQIAANHSRKSP